MDTIKINKQNTKMIAHRGLSGIETENTNAAFIAAGNRSYYGIETDVHRTADGKIVVCHDNDLKRIAGVDISVETSTLAALQSIVLFDKDGTKDRNDLRLTVLENYIAICKHYEKHCVLELKSAFTDAEILQIIDIIRSYDYLEQVTFISFCYDNLLKIRKYLPDQSAQFLFTAVTDDLIDHLLADRLDIDIHYQALTKDLVRLLHEKGFVVNCWTVDNPERAAELISWGVDQITSNILE